MVSQGPKYVCIGGLRQDYCITHDGRVHPGIMGGNAVYAAVGARLWSDSVGIVSRVGSNYPQEWLKELSERDFDLEGVKVLPEPQDTRTFYAYLSPEERVDTHPTAHFLRIHHPLPKDLIDYESSTKGQDKRDAFAPLAVRPDDLPEGIEQARGVHLAPADFLTHSTVPFRLRQRHVPLVSIDPSARYMDPEFRHDLPVILNGLEAFLPSEMEANAFFHPAEPELWEMVESFVGMGCRHVVIKCGARGQWIWDGDRQCRWRVPAYPAQLKDVTGAGDVYCGAFLVGLAETGDIVEAALRGSASASIAIEGTGVFFALDALPGLAQARLESLRTLVKKI